MSRVATAQRGHPRPGRWARPDGAFPWAAASVVHAVALGIVYWASMLVAPESARISGTRSVSSLLLLASVAAAEGAVDPLEEFRLAEPEPSHPPNAAEAATPPAPAAASPPRPSSDRIPLSTDDVESEEFLAIAVPAPRPLEALAISRPPEMTTRSPRPPGAATTSDAVAVAAPPIPLGFDDATPASPRHNPAPSYPGDAIRRGIEGRVMLRVTIDEEGTIAELTIAESSGHRSLDDAAVQALAQWRFEPARRGNRAVPWTTLLPINFSLR